MKMNLTIPGLRLKVDKIIILKEGILNVQIFICVYSQIRSFSIKTSASIGVFQIVIFQLIIFTSFN